ncbi:MAG: VOC family protein [Saprospiraceae bacterium]|nr:VOC family protein [Saprospiraceae bacterium]
MKIHRLTPIIWTEELEETIEFYTGMLGFICGERNDDWGWAALNHGDTEIMIAKPNDHTPFEKPGFTGTFYFNIDDADALWTQIRHKVKVVYDIENFEWGMREFAIFDNNGYTLQFGHEIAAT